MAFNAESQLPDDSSATRKIDRRLAVCLLSILERRHSKSRLAYKSTEEKHVETDTVKRPVPSHPVAWRVLHSIGNTFLQKGSQEDFAAGPEKAGEFAEVDANVIWHHVGENGVQIDDVEASSVEREPEGSGKRGTARVVALVFHVEEPKLELRMRIADVSLAPLDRLQMNIHSTVSIDISDLLQNPNRQTSNPAADIQDGAGRTQATVPNQTLGLRTGGCQKEIVILEFPSSEAQVSRWKDCRSADSMVGRQLTVHFRKNSSQRLYQHLLSLPAES